MKKIILFSLFTFLYSVSLYARKRIAAKDAARHLNEEVTVSDKICNVKFFPSSSLTLLDVGGNHPHELLTLVIKGENLKKFSKTTPESLKGKNVSVTGKLIDYKGKPEIVLTEPNQLKID